MASKSARFGCAVAAGLIGFVLWHPPLRAATRSVTDLGDSGLAGQLRAEINAAAAGDTIVIIPAGIIRLTGAPGEDLNRSGDLDILKNLTIQGAGPGVTIIDGGAVDGVFDILAGRTLVISGVTIQNGNSTQAGGGGIRNFGALSLSDAAISGNAASRPQHGASNFGGGIRNLGAMTLTRVTVANNLCEGNGGGVYNERGAVMTLTDVAISGNKAEIGGGGIYNAGTATLANVTVSANNADTSGGGIFSVDGGATTLANVTISGNRTAGSGGGMINSGVLNLTNVTVSVNAASFSGGGLLTSGTATLKNVILAGNTDVRVPGTANCSGPIVSLGHNLDNGATCALTGSGDLSNTDPMLGPLQNNGGFTLTQALSGGSPAIDAGTDAGCPPTDQRGAPRSAACDIGAYEFAKAAPARPVISANGVMNGASFQPLIAPGTFITIFGHNFADSQYSWDSAIPDGRTLPTVLGGVRVRINGKDCAIQYASPAQINALAPPDLAVGSAGIEVSTGGGTAITTATMSPYSPGLFSYSLAGKSYAAAMFANTGVYVAAPGIIAGVTSRQAKPGDYLQLYATGLGTTEPAYPAGEVLTRPYPVADLTPFRVTIGGISTPVLYAGMTFAGVFQVNIQVPQDIGVGDLPVVLTIAGQTTQLQAVLPFQR